MSIARNALLALVLCSLPAVAQNWSQWQSTGWPQWLGPDRNGISSETGRCHMSRQSGYDRCS